MNRNEFEKFYNGFMKKYGSYLKFKQLEDAAQNVFCRIVSDLESFESVNISYIFRGISFAKSREYRDSARTISFEDLNKDIGFELDLDIKIDIDKRIEEMAGKDEKSVDVLRLAMDGMKYEEIQKATHKSKAVISRVINGGRKEKRVSIGKIDKSNLDKYIIMAKKAGVAKDCDVYVRIKTPERSFLIVKKTGKILSNQFIKGAVRKGGKHNSFITAVDRIPEQEFAALLK